MNTVLVADPARMHELTDDIVDNASEKIRRLKAAGYRQADIARFLGVSDQFVSNVVRQAKRKKAENATSQAGGKIAEPLRLKVQIGPGGRIVIPAEVREAMGVSEGTVLFARYEDGEFIVSTPERVIRDVQAIVRQHIPEGVSLVDELIADRRREVVEEFGSD